MKIIWILFIGLGLISIGQVNAKSKSEARKKDLTATKIVEASRDPNNTGWVELNSPIQGKRFFRYRDNQVMCHALLDGFAGQVALNCK